MYTNHVLTAQGHMFQIVLNGLYSVHYLVGFTAILICCLIQID